MKFKNLRIFSIIVLAIVFAVSAFQTIKISYDYKTADKVNASLQEQFTKQTNDYYKPAVDSITEEKTSIPINVDFDELKKENKDIIGWIYCPDTPINYPVVKGKDNNQYLRTGLDGKYLFSGTIFCDYRSKDIGTESNYIIYGHNLKNSTMFGTLVKYKEQEYYDAHPIMYFLTPESNYIIELFAGTVVKNNSEIYQPNP